MGEKEHYFVCFKVFFAEQSHHGTAFKSNWNIQYDWLDYDIGGYCYYLLLLPFDIFFDSCANS